MRVPIILLCKALLCAALFVSGVPAQSALGLGGLPDLPEGLCAPDWEASFGGEPGIGDGSQSGDVYCAAVFDDGLGDGPVLYVGGIFATAGGQVARNIARWDGNSWSEPGGGVDHHVYDMVVMDDGGSVGLFVGGEFTTAGGLTVNHIARWDGSAWNALGSGADDAVWALDVIPDATQVLMLGGDFTSVDGLPAQRAALYTAGSGFIPFGDGFDKAVRCFAVHDGEIYAGGFFDESNGIPLANVARWTGSLWEDVDGGVNGAVFDMLSWGSGSTFGLYIAGAIVSAGFPAITLRHVARLQNDAWGDVGFPLSNTTMVRSLQPWDDGNGEQLYAAGWFGNPGAGVGNGHVARFDGADWFTLGTGLDKPAHCLIVHDDGAGESLWVGGEFSRADDRGASAIARWDGSAWNPLDESLNDQVLATHASTLFGGTPTLYIGGDFSVPGQLAERHVAAWQSGSWQSLGGADGPVLAFAEFDDGGGVALYAGGEFTSIGGVPANRLAKWDGVSWSAVGLGLDAAVRALAVWDDGGGAALYVGGDFLSAGGANANRMAAWDGASWSVLGTGMDAGGLIGDVAVADLVAYDDGGGEALFACGPFGTAGGLTSPGIARWDGGAWAALGSGLVAGSPTILPGAKALEVFDDGTGAELYVAGSFNSAGGVPGTFRIARWDGSNWSPLAFAIFCTIDALQVHADPVSGCALYAGGCFEQNLGSAQVRRVARWNGTSWEQPISTAFSGPSGTVKTFAVFDDGSGPRLVLGGSFTSIIGDSLGPTTEAPASYLGTFGGCWDSVNAWVDLGFALAGVSGDPLLAGTGSLALDSQNTLDLTNAAPSATAGLFLAFSSTPTPFAGGTLVPVPFLPPTLVNTTAAGDVLLSFGIPDCLPSGVTLYVQWVIVDGAAIAGYAMSNALVGTTP